MLGNSCSAAWCQLTRRQGDRTDVPAASDVDIKGTKCTVPADIPTALRILRA